jgi:hypothetical protein
MIRRQNWLQITIRVVIVLLLVLASVPQLIAMGLAGLRHFLVKNSLKPIYSNGFTSI